METIDIQTPVNLDMDRVAKARIADMAAAREALAAQRVVPGAATTPAPVAAPAAPTGPAAPGMAERAGTALKGALPPLPGMPNVSGGAIGKLARGSAKIAGKGAGYVAPVMEAMNVGKVALDPAGLEISGRRLASGNFRRPFALCRHARILV